MGESGRLILSTYSSFVFVSVVVSVPACHLFIIYAFVQGLLRTYCAQPLGIQWCFQGLQSLVKPIILPCAAQFKEGLGSHQQVGYRCHEAMGTVSGGEWNASL